jgi:CRISPR/Cas system-associated endonuclease/helicase Cas3
MVVADELSYTLKPEQLLYILNFIGKDALAKKFVVEVLPTGAGKTIASLIMAVYVVKHLEQEVLMLVPSILLKQVLTHGVEKVASPEVQKRI